MTFNQIRYVNITQLTKPMVPLLDTLQFAFLNNAGMNILLKVTDGINC